MKRVQLHIYPTWLTHLSLRVSNVILFCVSLFLIIASSNQVYSGIIQLSGNSFVVNPTYSAEKKQTVSSSKNPLKTTKQQSKKKSTSSKTVSKSSTGKRDSVKQQPDSARIKRVISDSSVVRDSSSFKKKFVVSMSDDSTINTSLADTLKKTQSQSGIDSTVKYEARDSITLYAKKKQLSLRGDSKAIFKTTKLEAENIDIYFDRSSMNAEPGKDSNGRAIGYPKFTDAGKVYAGETIKYNFKNKSGTVALGETSIENGYYFGTRIKRVDESTMFVQNGCYTTCDHPHPHFYFSSPEMKVLPGDRIFMQDMYVYVQDIPVFYLPLGMFFPNQGGRQSGLMIPRPFVSASRGVVFQDLGYYFAINDNWGSQLTFDIFSKGGISIKNKTDYSFRYITDGSLNLNYSYVRTDPRQDYSRDYRVAWTHRQTLIPNTTNFNASLDFQTAGFIRNTQVTLADRLRQTVRSAAGISHTFDNGIGLSLNYDRNQDIVVGTYDNNASFSMTVPALFPFKTLFGSGHWMSDFAINYGLSVSGAYNKVQTITTRTDSLRTRDTAFTNPYRIAVRHNPSFSIAPKFGFFTISPSVNLGWQTFFRRITRSYDASLGRTVDSEEFGVFNEYNISAGLSARTTLYGSPIRIGNTAFRHTMIPTVSLNVTPDLSPDRYGFYGTYTTPTDESNRVPQIIRYSRFVADGGGIASQRRSLSMNIALDNAIDAKVFGDSADTKIELLRVALNTGHDFVRDSLRWNDISWSVRTPSLGAFNFNTSFTTTLYQEAENRDTAGRGLGTYRRVNSMLINRGLQYALGRLTQFQIGVSANFSSQGVSFNNQTTPPVQDTTKKIDSTDSEIGNRFTRRMNYQDTESDLFGENSPGYSQFSVPWNVTFNMTYSYNKVSEFLESTSQLNSSVGLNFSITKTWQVRTGFAYDFINNQFNAPNVSVTKQIHCWALDFTWYPTGFNQGFYLRFAASAAMLRDLQLEKRSAPIFR
jgi:hypothetical protein